MVQPLFNGMLAILLAKFVINDLPHAAGLTSNPGFPKVNDVIILKVGVSPEEKLLRALLGGEALREPELTEEVMCECGKYRRIRYVGITCDRCGAPVKERKVLMLPVGWTVMEGRKWYKEHAGEWEYKPGYGYVRKE